MKIFSSKQTLIFGALLASSLADGQVLQTPSTDYTLVYRVEGTTKGKPSKGYFQISEHGTSLYLEYKGSNEDSFFLFFDGEKSLWSTNPTSATYWPGLWVNSLPFYPYLPFSYRNFNIFEPVDKVYKSHPDLSKTKVQELLQGATGSIFDGYRGNDWNNASYTGTFISSSAADHAPSMIKIGSNKITVTQIFYESYISFKNMQIPKKITVEKPEIGENHKGRLASQLHFFFDEEKSNVVAEFPELQGLLREGMFITYSDQRGDAGVVFDPKSGSFENQVDEQFKTQALGGSNVAKPTDQQESTLVPIILTCVFGASAGVLMWLRSRSEKKGAGK